MTARQAPFNAFLVVAVVDVGEEIQPLAYLTDAAGDQEEAKAMAMHAWRQTWPTQTIGGLRVRGADWRRLQPQEISRCVA